MDETGSKSMDLSQVRSEIDRVDSDILRLFIERMELAERAAQAKQAAGLPLQNRAREREILTRAYEAARERGMGIYAHRLFTSLIELSRAYQSDILAGSQQSAVRSLIERSLKPAEIVFPRAGRIAVQGIEGSHSQKAAEKLFPLGNVVFFKTFAGVFDAVTKGFCSHGVVPAENSTNGSVRAVFDLLRTRGCYVVRSTTVQIRHALLTKPGADPSEITTIYSHEQALGQCSRFLDSLGGKVRAIPCENTAVAARMVAESGDPHAAAISSAHCAEIYGLEVARSDIGDSENNYTRFFCVSHEPVVYAGSGRTCIVVGADNKPGALYSILQRLAAREIDMTKLESIPVPGSDFEYNFIIELGASVRDEGVMSLLEELERDCPVFDFLGCYADE